MINRVLIIQTAFIGDVILATALAEKLHQYYPEASIDFLLRKGNEGLLDQHPFINRVLVLDKAQKYRSWWKLLRFIRQQGYDLVVNPHRFALTGLLAGLSKAKYRIGFRQNPFSFLYSQSFQHHISATPNGLHEIERNQQLIAELTDAPASLPKLYPPKTAAPKAPKAQSYICIAPASVWFTKQLPATKWISLLNALTPNLPIYLIGGKGDWQHCEKIKTKSNHPKVHNWAGKLNLLESAALIRDAKLTYANDSAPLHMASAVDAPVISIFCSTVPEFGFTPTSTKQRVVQTDQALNCRPCGIHGKKACPKGHFACANIKLEKLLDWQFLEEDKNNNND